MTDNDYVLGTSDYEVRRLYLQHHAWRSYVFDGWRRARFRRGQTLLDLGCGPGAATLDLAELVGSEGRVYAVDRSRIFIEVLEASAASRGLSNITTICSDVLDFVPTFLAEGIWSRWLGANQVER
jgi:ubiquinone/menaquinone biosynthesis C-methylase UbiE